MSINIKDVYAGRLSLPLDKRDEANKCLSKIFLNQDYKPNEMQLGDVGFCTLTKYYLDKIAYKDNIYYIYDVNFIGMWIESKDDNSVPKEVTEIASKIYKIRMQRLCDMQKEEFEEKHKGV